MDLLIHPYLHHDHCYNHDHQVCDHHCNAFTSRDLALAGEFGRELLQTNDELRAALERQRQDSARRIEVLMMAKLVTIMVTIMVMIMLMIMVMSLEQQWRDRDRIQPEGLRY